jgi:subtilase family serine protease
LPAVNGVNNINSVNSTSPDLSPYQPAGWSDKIVVSKVAGTNTDDSPWLSTDQLYIDWAVLNSGTATAVQFITRLYVDGTLIASWNSAPPVPNNSYAYVTDYSIGQLAAGSHTLQIVADATGAIAESNESNNTYTRTIIINDPSNQDLTPYQPSGWSDKIVVSKVTGTHTDDSPLVPTDQIYVDWAVINNGAATSVQFVTRLYLDGVLKTAWNSPPPLQAGSYSYVSDYSLGQLDAGTHTLQIVTDATNVITETNESNNEYIRTFVVTGADLPDLQPYQPSGWSNKIVVSNSTGSQTDDSPLYSTEDLFIDWAVINRGVATESQFFTQLYVNGVLLQTWYTDPPLPTDYYSFVKDYSLGKYSAGNYTVRIVTDAAGAISESDESNNEFTRSFTVIDPPNEPIISVEPSSLTIQQPGGGLIPVNRPDNHMTSEPLAVDGGRRLGGRVSPADLAYWNTHQPPAYKLKSSTSVIDWSSNDSPVKDQGNCGSCWVFAAVALIENLGLQNDLSEQTVLSCSDGGTCEEGGYPRIALQYIQSNGVPPESCYPYSEANGNCSDKCNSPAFLERITTVPTVSLWGEATVNNIKAQLQEGPLVVRMLVPGGFSDFFNSNPTGIYNYSGGAISESNGHIVLLVGYDDALQSFKVKNSWGTSWGDNGYFRIAYDDVTDDIHFGWYAYSGSGVYTDYLTSGNEFIVSNLGMGDLSITSITANREWLSAQHPNTPFAIGSGNSQEVVVAVDWTKVGDQETTATLTIESNDRTVNVTVTAIPAASSDATLSDLKVDGATVSNFSPSVLDYYVELPFGATTVPSVTATTTNEGATKTIIPTLNLPGTTLIVVTAANGTATSTYSVGFTVSTEDPYKPPRDLTSSLDDQDVILNWNAPVATTAVNAGYRIYRNQAAIAFVNDPSVLTFRDAGLAVGTYSYYVTTLYSNPAGESTGSNVVSIAVMSKPDVQITGIALSPPVINCGTRVLMSTDVANNGSTDAIGMIVQYYISPDQNISARDINLGCTAAQSMSGSSTIILQNTFNMPFKLDAGTFYIIAVIDPDNSITESDETNNVFIKPFILSDNTGITDFDIGKTISIYPNPATDQIHIDLRDFPDAVDRIEIRNYLGQTVYSNFKVSALSIVQVSSAGWASGGYFVQVTSGGKRIRKMVIVL